MAKTIVNTSESIIEYREVKDSPDFLYFKEVGAITIIAAESKWIWRTGFVKINSQIFYDDTNFNLLFMSNDRRVIAKNNFIFCGCSDVLLYNIKTLPIFIKKGTILGTAILIPKIESHILEIE